MRTIRTRYLGYTNFKPARIKADDGEGHSFTISYDAAPGDRTEDKHQHAAQALIEKTAEGVDKNGVDYHFSFHVGRNTYFCATGLKNKKLKDYWFYNAKNIREAIALFSIKTGLLFNENIWPYAEVNKSCKPAST